MHFLREMVLFLKVGRRLLRLGCCAGRPSPSKVSCWVARKTHATFSPTLRCVLFVIEAVCSMACSVLTRITMFWFFSRRIPGAVCFSLFHCKAMKLLAIHCWSVLIFLLPRFILRAAARHRSSFELLAQHIS